ncbi:MAG: hypothetical protein QM535_03780 [Limnohabitans sp.]|nr:hypothetical protein [Limnohabitans sp.]
MSYNIKDKVIIKDESYTFIRCTETKLFTPQDFGIKPIYYGSMLMSGYCSVYKVNEDLDFVLDKLYVNASMNQDIKVINGCSPSNFSKTDFDSKTTFYEYKNLNLVAPLSGFVLVGNDYIDALKYRFYDESLYKITLELEVKNGKIAAIKDCSKLMEQYREKFNKGDLAKKLDKRTIDKEIRKWFNFKTIY